MKNFRVYLRALEPSDYKISITWRNDDQIWSMLGGPKYYVSEAYEKQWVEKTIFDSKDIKLAICLCSDNRYIGNVYMTNIDLSKQSCHSQILIGEKDCWGKGYASEAMFLICKYMFEERNIHRIQSIVLENNVQSLKMHEKCGFQIEGLMRHSTFKNGKWQNQYILSLLKEDFYSNI